MTESAQRNSAPSAELVKFPHSKLGFSSHECQKLPASITMDDASVDIHYWLQKAMDWQQMGPTLDALVDQTELVGQLSSYLHRLGVACKTVGSVAEVLRQCPQVGQLLGRLTTLPGLLLDQDLYRILMECILFFYMKDPISAVERKSKSWVLSQIRSMCLSQSSASTSPVINLTGHSPADRNTVMLRKICEHIEGLMADLVSNRNGSLAEGRAETILNVCHVCLKLRSVKAFEELLDQSLLLVVNCSSRDPRKQELFRRMAETQLRPYTDPSGVIPLSYRCQTLLWLDKPASLEHEVLDLVQWALSVSLLDRGTFSAAVNKRHLVQFCADHDMLSDAVICMLQRLLQESGWHWSLVRVTSWLHRGIRHHDGGRNDRLNRKIGSSLYLAVLDGVLRLLNLPPKGLPLPSCERHVSMVTQCLRLARRHLPDSYHGYPLVGVCYLEWYTTILALVFCCDTETVLCCLETLTTLSPHQLTELTLPAYQDLVLSLRGLLSKSRLCEDDVTCATSAVARHLPAGRVALVTQLLVTFVLLAKDGLRVANHVVGLVCGSDGSHDDRVAMVITMTSLLLDTEAPWLSARITEVKVTNVVCSLLSGGGADGDVETCGDLSAASSLVQPLFETHSDSKCVGTTHCPPSATGH